MIAVNIFFCEEKQKDTYSHTTLKAFVYHQWYPYHNLETTAL